MSDTKLIPFNLDKYWCPSRYYPSFHSHIFLIVHLMSLMEYIPLPLECHPLIIFLGVVLLSNYKNDITHEYV